MKHIQICAFILTTLGLISMASAKPLFGYPTYSKCEIEHAYPECLQQAYPEYVARHCPDFVKCEKECCVFPSRSGFFVGLKGGYGFAKGNQKLSINDTLNNNQFTKRQKARLSANQGFIGALFGYDYYFCDSYMLGLEADFKWTSQKTKNVMNTQETNIAPLISVISNASFHVNTKESFEIAMRFGKLIYNCVLPYVKVGADFTKFKTKLSTNTTLSTGQSVDETKFSHKYRVGVLAGLGFEVPLYECYTIGGEVTHTQFKGIHISKTDAATSGKAHIRMYSTALAARVTYKF